MKRNLLYVAILIVLTFPGCVRSAPVLAPTEIREAPIGAQVKLPEPKLKGDVSLEETLHQRRSLREYTDEALTLEEVSQLLWAAQGVTAPWGGRTAPSEGALYPLEVYVAVGNVENLAAGVYKYKPERHVLTQVKNTDVRKELSQASLWQKWVQEAPIDIVIAAVYERTTGKYGNRGITYVQLEGGHAAQNIYLQATALDMGMVTVGAFHDGQVKEVMAMTQNERPLYVIPVGRKP